MFLSATTKKVNFPIIPDFNINEATDVLLKRDFNEYHAKAVSHPFLKAQGYGHLIPFDNEDFELWMQSLHSGAACHHFSLKSVYVELVGDRKFSVAVGGSPFPR